MNDKELYETAMQALAYLKNDCQMEIQAWQDIMLDGLMDAMAMSWDEKDPICKLAVALLIGSEELDEMATSVSEIETLIAKLDEAEYETEEYNEILYGLAWTVFEELQVIVDEGVRSIQEYREVVLGETESENPMKDEKNKTSSEKQTQGNKRAVPILCKEDTERAIRLSREYARHGDPDAVLIRKRLKTQEEQNKN